MSRTYALLLDGGFVVARLRDRVGQLPTVNQVLAECERIASSPWLRDHELLRIYYYDAPPYERDVTNPLNRMTVNLARSEAYAARKHFLDRLELSPNVALRKGELAFRGWRLRESALREIAASHRPLRPEDLAPELEQKGVDLRIGLDIARLSLRHMVDAIVVVTGDSDMVPAFKFARREGLRVYLDHLGGPVMRELKAHVDVTLV